MCRVWGVLLTLVLLVAGMMPVYAQEGNYQLSAVALKVGKNTVVTEQEVTLYRFKPTAVGYYCISVDDPDAVLSFWYGSSQYVSCEAERTVGGDLLVTCTAVGQTLLIGLTDTLATTITITAEAGYVPRSTPVYETYRNTYRFSGRFRMVDDPLTAVDITKPQTVVTDSKGIYHLNTVDGPILYVNMRASIWSDLYLLYYPEDVEGEEWPPVDTLRARREEKNGKWYCYDFVDAMASYADALDDGYFYLTVDLANFIQLYGRDQGWFIPQYSPFAPIKEGNFIEESAWLVNVYYVAEDAVPGDLNGSGAVNTQDLALLQRHLNGWNVTVDTDAADVTGDGKVNTQDLALLQRYLNGWNVTLK